MRLIIDFILTHSFVFAVLSLRFILCELYFCIVFLFLIVRNFCNYIPAHTYVQYNCISCDKMWNSVCAPSYWMWILLLYCRCQELAVTIVGEIGMWVNICLRFIYVHFFHSMYQWYLLLTWNEETLPYNWHPFIDRQNKS